MAVENKITKINNATDLKTFLATNYLNQIKNFFSDEKQAMKFLSSVMADVQKTPKLLECEPTSLVNSYMTMAQLGFMPSSVSGEAYVLPYAKNSKEIIDGKEVWSSVMQAQFQLGYQGLVTLFYKAGVKSIRAEVVREKDKFSYENGVIKHTVDVFKPQEERGEVKAVYAIANVNGEELSLAMNVKDIMVMGAKYSKSYASKNTPWKEENDPNDWMKKKTVLKQLGKLLPKNELINIAIAKDNEEGDLKKPIQNLVENSGLQMGKLLKSKENNAKENKNNQEESQETNFKEPEVN